MNNLVVFFVIIVDIPFHIIVSNGCHTTGKYDAITLSEKSLELIKNKFNPEDVALEMKKRYYGFFEQLENFHMESFYHNFTCAVNTCKSVINYAKDSYEIFYHHKFNTSGEQKTLRKLKFPEYLRRLVTTGHDGSPPEGKTMKAHLSLILNRFRSFFFNLKKYGEDDIFVRLRALLNPGNKLNEAELDEVYTMFSATIVRDYSFFRAEHHSNLAKLLNDVNPPSSQHVIASLMKENRWWYYDRVHIQNMNIFLKAFYNNTQFPEIEGFPCKNGIGKAVEIPLHHKCGLEPKYTFKPVIL